VGVALGTVLVVGSLAEIHAQSSTFRSATDSGYGALAARLVDASNRTGTQLGQLMAGASGLTNQAVPGSARDVLEQGLDEAVDATAAEATQATQLEPPSPDADVGERFAGVMADRATAAVDLRTALDRMLGMSPLPVAGAPSATAPPSTAPLISIGQTSARLAAVGLLLQRTDGDYRRLTADIRQQRLPIRLPRSVWVPAPAPTAPLGAIQLGAAAPALAASASLVPIHQLVITAVGLTPPAVATGGPGTVGDGCGTPMSTVPGAAPTVLPPTASLDVGVTVTNCGTVVESDVAVSETLTLADPAGATPPPAGAGGSGSRVVVTLEPGSSTAPPLAPLTVASGYRYTLTVALTIPPGQTDPTGSTQQFLLQIAG
jgi:hypothetical protein